MKCIIYYTKNMLNNLTQLSTKSVSFSAKMFHYIQGRRKSPKQVSEKVACRTKVIPKMQVGPTVLSSDKHGEMVC